jgi:hypothetical protein
MKYDNFCLDVETTDIDSSAIVLSAAIVGFNLTEDFTYEDLVDRTLYVKFIAKEQKAAGRTASRDTLEWWDKQGEEIKRMCFLPSKKDVSALEGLDTIRSFIAKNGNKDYMVWTRGCLDQMVMESLCRTFKVDPITSYNSFCDVRTALRCLKSTTNNRGYCDIPNFDRDKISKHNPIDDIALDVLMLRYGV